MDLAAAWFNGLGDAMRHSAAQVAVGVADTLQSQLDDLQERVAMDPEVARAEVHAWIRRRDDLECVRFLLHGTRDAAMLNAALEALDHEAGIRQSMFLTYSFTDDDRLGAVSWQEPDAWWSTLVFPA